MPYRKHAYIYIALHTLSDAFKDKNSPKQFKNGTKQSKNREKTVKWGGENEHVITSLPFHSSCISAWRMLQL